MKIQKKFVILWGLLFSCSLDLGILDGPFSAVGDIEDDDGSDFEQKGFVVWVDGPTLYRRGFLRIIAEDFGNGENSLRKAKAFREKYLKKTQRFDGPSYPIVWDFDWYQEPINFARIVFESSTHLGVGFKHTLHTLRGVSAFMRVMLPFPSSSEEVIFDEYSLSTDSYHVTDSGTRNITIRASELTQGNDLVRAGDYFRSETIANQRRATFVIASVYVPNKVLMSPFNENYFPDSLVVDSLRVFQGSDVAKTYILVAQNAFGLVIDTDANIPQQTGYLDFVLKKQGNVVGSYHLDANQTEFLRNIFLGTSISTSFLLNTYSNYLTFSYSQEGPYKVARVQRRNDINSNICNYSLKVAGLSTIENEDDDEIIVSSDLCSAGSESWDQAISSINALGFSSNYYSEWLPNSVYNGTTVYHFNKAQMLTHTQATTFNINSQNFTIKVKKSDLAPTSGPGSTDNNFFLQAFMKMLREDGMPMMERTSTNSLAFTQNTKPHEHFTMIAFPTKEDYLRSSLRQGIYHLWWPQEEFLKLRAFFNQ